MGWYSTDLASQLGHFRDVDAAHYSWQTDGGYFSATERELILSAGLPTDGTLLEIGCGEGGNLYHLGARKGWVGLDFAADKLEHASRHMPDVRFVCGDAGRLPFADASFDAVLIRDVLHHVPSRTAVVEEATRVLVPGGKLGVIEPNRNSPLIMAQALAIKAERAVLKSTASRMKSELEAAGLENVSVSRAQPFPLARIALHPSLGFARFGKSSWVAALLRAGDSVARRVVVRSAWMYLVGQARKPA